MATQQRLQPRCYGCNKKLLYNRPTAGITAQGQATTYPGNYEGYGLSPRYLHPLFCTLRCACRAAEVFINAGRRITFEGETCNGGDREQKTQ